MRSCGPLRKVLILTCSTLVFALPLGVSQAATRAQEASTAVDYYFHGMPDDQAQKAVSFGALAPPPAGNLTFSQSSAFDATPVTQNMGNPNSEFVLNPLAVWWTGPATGTLNGDMVFDWWWQTSNATGIALGVEVNIKVVANPDFTNPGVGTQEVIGQTNTRFMFADAQPTRFITTVPVNGTLSGQMLIQAATLFVDTGPGLTALYDNAMFPSKFSAPFVTTAAKVLSFAGKATGRTGVSLTWRTASEVGVLGYNVWRSGSNGKAVKVNRMLVSAHGASGGARYRYVDRGVRRGSAYTYRLEAVHRNGSTTWHGTARVRVTR